jgi:hypothetical protein
MHKKNGYLKKGTAVLKINKSKTRLINQTSNNIESLFLRHKNSLMLYLWSIRFIYRNEIYDGAQYVQEDNIRNESSFNLFTGYCTLQL